jgi:hypothetical protein
MRELDYDIAGICRHLHETFEAPTPTYAMVWSLVASGRIAAERVGRKLLIRRDDVPKVAAHYKLTPKKRSA